MEQGGTACAGIHLLITSAFGHSEILYALYSMPWDMMVSMTVVALVSRSSHSGRGVGRQPSNCNTVWQVPLCCGAGTLLWAELCPPKKYVKVLAPGIYECDLIWELGLCRCNQINIRSLKLIPKWFVNLLLL